MRKEIIVKDIFGKYENPLAELVSLSCGYNCDVYAENEGKKCNLKSIMGIMAFNWDDGITVTLSADGDDADNAITAIEKYLTCEVEA